MGVSRRLTLVTLILSWVGLIIGVQQSYAQNQPPLTLQVIDGFEARLVVDDDLAHDIHSMTLDPDGQLVVGGPGYIRRMFDDALAFVLADE